MFKRINTTFIVATVALAGLAGSALAKDLALVISNGTTRQHNELAEAYHDQGYEVIDGKNMDSQEMREAFESFMDRMDGKDKVVVHFSGQAVHIQGESWLLPVDVRAVSLLHVDYNAPSLSLVLELLGQNPGRGMLFFAKDGDIRTTAPLQSDLGDLQIPQGVLVLSGSGRVVNDLVMYELLSSEKTLADILIDRDRGANVTLRGYVSADISLGAAEDDEKPDTDDGGTDWINLVAEQTLWAVADRSNRKSDFEEYLRRFPNGVFAPAAQARLDVLNTPEVPSAEEIEKNLKLSRGERRDIQTNLTLLGFNTRGVDGIFGRGTRGAIADWQQSERHEKTGFLTGRQVASIQDQAEVRRIENAAEDRRYWESTGASGIKRDLQKYLDKYPRGIYSAQAKRSLATIVAEEKQAKDDEAWEVASSIDTARSYRQYLQDFPRGTYANTAQRRLDRFEPTQLPETDAAKTQEDRMRLNAATRLLIESRLGSLGYNPGNKDGHFDGATRRAISNFQRDKGIDATGYMNSATVQALLLG